jgi:predicted esterase
VVKTRLVIALWCLPLYLAAQKPLEDALSRLTSAASPRDEERIIREVVRLKPSFEELMALIRRGPQSTSVRRGFFTRSQNNPLLPPACLVFVPYDYSPAKSYPVRIFMHGAVSNNDPDFVFRGVDTTQSAYRTSQVIQLFPAGWSLAPWWSETQLNNIHALLKFLKQTYQVDDNDVRLAGVSDGGIGSFYMANADITPWSAITPFIGSLEALQRIHVKPVYMNNLSGRPFLIINGGKDKIFRKETQLPYFELLKSVNRRARTIMVDSTGHSMSWYPVLRDTIQQFYLRHRREPFPDTLTWQTESEEQFNRCHYVVIRRLKQEPDAGPDVNQLPGVDKRAAFFRNPITGYVQVIHDGNSYRIRTHGVARLSLLIGVDEIDWNKPVMIELNGAWRQLQVQQDIKALLSWFVRDHDRQMLFGAELDLAVR